MSTPETKNVSVYIDGFNLYHAIDSLGKNELKWLSYHKLAESFLRTDERLFRVYLFTSLTIWAEDKKERHQTYMDALRATGVEIVEARFKKAKKYCRRQDRYCKFWEEKENDVAIAVRMIADAHAGSVHRIILVTADTDQLPAVRYIQERFADNIELSLVIPPGRKDQARDLGALFSRSPIEIEEGRLRANLLPAKVKAANGEVILRPAAYDPDAPNLA